MSEVLPNCPECGESYAYEMGALLVCPMCGHEWSAEAVDGVDGANGADGANETGANSDSVKDAVGNALADGDTVTIVKDLKIKGAGGGTLKVGTKVKGIRLVADSGDGHDIDATVPGFGRMQLKSSVVKKVL